MQNQDKTSLFTIDLLVNGNLFEKLGVVSNKG